MFTFVIPAHNEQESIGTIVRQALGAARADDRVLVVDSASTDATAQRAAAAGAEVLHGPRGKGAAVAAALSEVRTPWVCLLDADLFGAEVNVPARLREAALASGTDHVVGDYEYADPGTILSSTFAIYQPLVDELFPEVGELGANALTGYRAVRRHFLDGGVPADFGLESYLNISVAVAGGTATVTHLGVIESRFRYKPDMGREIGRTILDLAVAHGRLDPLTRTRWDRWVAETAAVVAGIGDTRAGRSAALAKLFTAVRRPLPSRLRHPAEAALLPKRAPLSRPKPDQGTPAQHQAPHRGAPSAPRT